MGLSGKRGSSVCGRERAAAPDTLAFLPRLWQDMAMLSHLRTLVAQPIAFALGLLVVTLALGLAGCGGKSRVESPPQVRHGSLSGGAIIRTAKTQLGKKYVNGGTTPATGFDCSGLIYWSYRQYGVDVPRSTTGQMKAGRAVSMKQIQQGDIVVFRTGRSRLHTGMYSGGGKFIHSPRTGKNVREESLASTYWKPRLVTIRRIL